MGEEIEKNGSGRRKGEKQRKMKKMTMAATIASKAA